MSRMCLGVRNCPFVPAVFSLESMYSYRSPRSAMLSPRLSNRASMPSTAFCSVFGVGMPNVADSMLRVNAESSPRPLMKGKANSLTVLYMVSAGLSLKRLQRSSLPSISTPATLVYDLGKMCSWPTPRSVSIFSISNSRSSSWCMNIKYVSWLMTSSGLVMPPSHIFCQMSSTLFLVAPVITFHLLLVWFG